MILIIIIALLIVIDLEGFIRSSISYVRGKLITRRPQVWITEN